MLASPTVPEPNRGVPFYRCKKPAKLSRVRELLTCLKLECSRQALRLEFLRTELQLACAFLALANEDEAMADGLIRAQESAELVTTFLPLLPDHQPELAAMLVRLQHQIEQIRRMG